MKNLFVTTHTDLGIEDFKPYCDVLFLENFKESFSKIKDKKFDTVYFRSQFSNPATYPDVFRDDINQVALCQQESGAYFVDGAKSTDDIMGFEDKWNQYQIFRDFMPETWLFSDAPKQDKLIYKKRISSRATGIEFEANKVKDPENWIAQERMDILQEIRVYTICGEVYKFGSIKNSKTESQQVKIMEIIELPEEIMNFAQKIINLVPNQDFLGLDVAETNDGLRLIEANRSPVFSSFNEKSGKNLAAILYNKLSNRINNH